MKNLSFVLILASAVVLATHLSSLATRSTAGRPPLQARVEMLEKAVARHRTAIDGLKQRMAALEGASKPTHTHQANPDTTGWDLIKYGLNKKRVRFLLGDPVKISKRDQIMVWLYPDNKGGKVEFDNDKVVRWTVPPKKKKYRP
ncbi:MAG: hypothetical protein ACE5GE_04145 [Phycisphaerae bacterium]